MKTLKEVRRYKTKLVSIAKRYKASHLRVFGSVARGDATKNSDVDFLVKLGKSASLLDIVGLQQAFSKLLKVKVDIVPDEAINKRFQDIVMREAVML